MPSAVQPPRGMRDFLPAEKAKRDGVMAAIRDSFASFGYREIETPATEELSRLQSGEGGDNEKLIYKILKRGLDPQAPIEPARAADLGLRFDLTVPLSRFYATHRGVLPDVFRSIQIAPVWRAERPQKGRYRQFTQCDIDVIGEASDLAEIELITATVTAVEGLGIEDTSVRINDRTVLLALLDSSGFAPASHAGVLITVDKLDKIGLAGVADELRSGGAGAAGDRLVAVLEAVAATGAGDDQAALDLGAAVSDFGAAAFDAVLDALPEPAVQASGRLRSIRASVAAAAPDVRLVADPTLVRGMGYYTGPIFELAHPSFSGAVGGGGRYDGMIGRLAGRDVPACGFSIGFERIVDLVDPARFRGTRRRLAVVYEAGADPGALVAWQRRLIADGADVRLVPRIRNQGRLLDELAADGFSAYLELGADATAPAPEKKFPELRPIRPSGRA